MNRQNLTKFCIHIIIDKIYVGIVKHHVLKFCNRVTALDLCQNLVFAQYLENEWTEVNHMHITIYKLFVGIVTRHQFFKQSYASEYTFVL